jgi:hypothetical protein
MSIGNKTYSEVKKAPYVKNINERYYSDKDVKVNES